LAVVVAGCGSTAGPSTCTVDKYCGGQVCARNGECVSASTVRMVKVTWTIRGQQASATACGSTPSLELWFNSPQDYFGYAPVPCMEGQFTIDKIPTRYDEVELDVDGGSP